jgi:hypothetical protein
MLRHVALVRTDVSDGLSASIIGDKNKGTKGNVSCNLQPTHATKKY